ncbi:gastrula zinc finger protein XlCGF64.1-like [Corythoichthys intestinalis]|uniref:gastrula zinc finger protein XlCGF64.1-like n=1 Tax=Corythoichthys intestinalis TaxID=161448 RepID=UPI0025A52277|nr:gastrula zinc finger protein XlCGF64.1-like [Corythoichthys intestinalis]
MCAKRVKEEYEEELHGTKEETERQYRPLSEEEASNWFDHFAHNVVEEQVQSHLEEFLKQEELQSSQIKNEEEDLFPIKGEEEGFKISQEDENVQDKLALTIEEFNSYNDEADGGSHADNCLAPLSDSDDITSHSSDTDDEHSKVERTCHVDNKRCQCSQCDKSFFNKSELKRHMRKHTGEKPYACSVCGETFTWRSGLVRHSRKHTGEKPYACTVCDEKFAHKEQLGRHTTSHTGGTHFTCLVCGKIFTWKTGLIRHTRSHSGEKPFACSVCGKTFNQKTTLMRHTRTHTGVKPFACSVCDQRFTQKGNLEKHLRQHTLVLPSVNFCLLNLPPDFH